MEDRFGELEIPQVWWNVTCHACALDPVFGVLYISSKCGKLFCGLCVESGALNEEAHKTATECKGCEAVQIESQEQLLNKKASSSSSVCTTTL